LLVHTAHSRAETSDLNIGLQQLEIPAVDSFFVPLLCIHRISTISLLFRLLYDSPASAASLSALRALFSNRAVLRAPKMVCCLVSTPCNHHPKLAPTPPNNGYAHRDSLFQRGRISMPSCQKRTARPKPPQKSIL